MSDTIRRGMIEVEPGSGWFCRYWMHHDPKWYRKHLNRCFRFANKQYLKKFGEALLINPPKNRGWYW